MINITDVHTVWQAQHLQLKLLDSVSSSWSCRGRQSVSIKKENYVSQTNLEASAHTDRA